MMPFFSIIIPTYNRSQVLPKAIDSVLSQAFHNFELIVVDDGSNDNTEELVETKYGGRVKYVHQQNAGVCAARNNGAKLASGKFLVFLDSDDWLSEDCLLVYQKALMDSSLKLALGMIYYFDESDRKQKEKYPINYMENKGQSLPGAFAIEREFFLNLGGYDTELTYAENTDLFLRIRFNKLIPSNQVTLVSGGGVCKIKEDGGQRRERYSMGRYRSVKYFLSKHSHYFETSKSEFINFQRVLAVSALGIGDYREARRSLAAIIRKFPGSIKTYFQLMLFLFPIVAKKYYNLSIFLNSRVKQ